MTRTTAILLVALSAASYAAGIPPLCWRPLAWVALVPLLAVAAGVRPIPAAAAGLLWGTLATIGCAWWLPSTLAAYFDTATWVGWLGLIAIGTLYAGVPSALFAAWIATAAARGRIGPWRVALAWGGAELLRTYALPDPWALLGYTQVDWPAAMQIADLGGVYLVGVLIAAVSATIAAGLVPALRGRRFGRSAATVVAAVAASLLYGRRQLAVAADDGARFTVGIVQSGVERGFRWRREYRELGVAEHLTPSATLRRAGVDLLVWPEHAVSFYVQEPTPARQRLFAGLTSLGGDVVLGGPHYGRDQSAVVYHNSAFLVHDGAIVARYDKQHLVPLAETTGPTHYTAGEVSGTLPARVGRLGPLVCFEAVFPGLARAATRAGAQVLLSLTNDSWLQREPALRHHLEIASVRAIESRRWLIRAAATGYSAVVDPWGRIVARSVEGAPDSLRADAAARDGLTLYDEVGDWPLAALALAAVAAGLLGPRQR